MADNIRIIRPRRDDSCYEFEIQNQNNGRKSKAFLTYELFPNQTFERTLLLCENPDVFSTVLTTLREKTAYGTLAEMLKAPSRKKLGQAKLIVNKMADGEFQIDCIRVAVHTFGPVPVVVSERFVELQVHGRRISANLAYFPKADKTGVGSTYGFPFFVSTKSEFRKCMSISPHLVFQRYFEDIAENLHDIRRTLRQVDFYRRAREVEKIVGASIGSKLKSFIPKISRAKTSDPELREAWDYFMAHAVILYETKIASLWAVFLLNEVYQTIGVFSNSSKLKEDITECHNHFANLLGDKQAMELRSNSRLLQFLDECQLVYHSVDLLQTGFDAAQRLFSLAKDAPNPWAKEFTKFAAFSLITQTIRGSTRFVKLFISHHYEVPASEILYSQIEDAIIKEYGRRVAVLSVKNLPPSTPYRHIIRAAIWLSSGLIAVCPANSAPISNLSDKGYKWIARESEYSLLLKKNGYVWPSRWRKPGYYLE